MTSEESNLSLSVWGSAVSIVSSFKERYPCSVMWYTLPYKNSFATDVDTESFEVQCTRIADDIVDLPHEEVMSILMSANQMFRCQITVSYPDGVSAVTFKIYDNIDSLGKAELTIFLNGWNVIKGEVQ